MSVRRRYAAEYKAWKNMRARCSPGNRDHVWYYDKGIRVDPVFDDFEVFLAEVGPRPSSKHSLDRKDGTKGYAPGNLRWADVKTQRRNRSSVRLTEREAHQVRWLDEMGYQQWRIGRMFGMTQPGVNHVVRRRSWT